MLFVKRKTRKNILHVFKRVQRFSTIFRIIKNVDNLAAQRIEFMVESILTR